MYRESRHRKAILAAAIAVLTISSGRGTAQMPVFKVVAVEARTVEAPSTITVVGTVEPLRRSKVSSEIDGLVHEMPGREGDLVEDGGVICKLNDDTLKLHLAEEEAELAALQARHEELLAGTRKEELARLKALFDEAVAWYERWTFEMDRIKRLYAGRDSNEREYFDTKAEFVAAERRKIATEAAYKLGVEGPRKQVIAQAAHAVARQKAVVGRAASDLDKAVIRAPFAGHIVERLTEVGEWISVGDPVVDIVDLSFVLVRANVPESALPYLVVGDPVHVKLDALQRSFEGRIKHIMRQADPIARTFPIKIEVPNSKGLIAGGMFARATVPSGPSASVVAVPKDAVVERDGGTYVAMLIRQHKGGMSGILAPVTVGADVGDWIVVTSGNVRPGTQVITRGTERILPFPTPVEVVDELGTPVATPNGEALSPGKDGA